MKALGPVHFQLETIYAEERPSLSDAKDFLHVLPVAAGHAASAVPILGEAEGGRFIQFGLIAARIGNLEIDVTGFLPGHGELQGSGLDATTLVDDAVAVVVG